MVGILETGYAVPSSRIAEFNGVRMTLISSNPQVNVYGQVYGFLNYYSYSGSWSSGSFTYQSTSLVSPYRTLSMRVLVE